MKPCAVARTSIQSCLSDGSSAQYASWLDKSGSRAVAQLWQHLYRERNFEQTSCSCSSWIARRTPIKGCCEPSLRRTKFPCNHSFLFGVRYLIVISLRVVHIETDSFCITCNSLVMAFLFFLLRKMIKWPSLIYYEINSLFWTVKKKLEIIVRFGYLRIWNPQYTVTFTVVSTFK